MLDRISNINPKEKYKSGLKVSTNPYAVNRHDQEKHHSKDSAMFSPLAKLMSKINWRILNIEFPSDDEMLFNFLVNGLEFITIINFNEMYNNPYQEFSVFHIDNKYGKKVQYETKLKIKKNDVSVLDKPDPIDTENTYQLFERIKKLNIRSNYQIIEHHILDGFVNDIANSVSREFNYILKVIYTFISTRNKKRIKNNFLLKTQKNIPIMMQKVTIIYAE
jgi:hypothetical protein